MKPETTVTADDLQTFRQAFNRDPAAKIAARAASRTALDQICYDPAHAKHMNHKFSLEIPTMEACNQKHSGRCWIFSALNVLREKTAKDLDLQNFEFSESYISFYDHLEKANTFLIHIMETWQSPLDDRYVSRLLSEPIGDGGWWEYFSGLCSKYGLVPKDAMEETYQSEHTDTMNMLLNMQLRKDALTLRTALQQGKSPEILQDMKKAMLSRVYRVLSVCLGLPPQTFDFEYVDSRQNYHADRNLTPLSFYEKYAGRNLQDMVSILHAPISQVPFYETCYTQGEESIYGSFQAKRLNLPLEEFKEAVIRQLQAGEPTWFVCDCDYFLSREEGIWDTGLYDYEALLGLDLSMSKEQLLQYRQCSLNHAMAFTGVNLVDGKPDKWKIQNSWGTEDGRKGYFICSDAWFDRYVFTATIDRKYLTETQWQQFCREPLILPPWNVLA